MASQILRAVVATAIAGLLAILFPLCILPFLPPLKPLAFQLLYRLREVFAFLAFTTAIAIGIFSSQRKEAGRKNPPLEFHPLASIFGEPGYGEADVYTESADEGKKKQQHQHQQKKKNSLSLYREGDDEEGKGEDDAVDLAQGKASATVNGSSLLQQKAMVASRRRNLPASKEEGSLDVESKVASAVQSKLHRRSSSLDDTINYEQASHEDGPHDKKQKHGVQQQDITTTMSPNELTRQADAFITKFKEQMRMQRLESFQRYRRRVP